MGDIKFAKDLDDAYSKGYFSGSITRHELLDKITRKHPDLRYIYGKNAIGMYSRNKYIAGIGHINPIPKFSILQETSKKMLAKGWPKILQSLRRQGYEVDDS